MGPFGSSPFGNTGARGLARSSLSGRSNLGGPPKLERQSVARKFQKLQDQYPDAWADLSDEEKNLTKEALKTGARAQEYLEKNFATEWVFLPKKEMKRRIAEFTATEALANEKPNDLRRHSSALTAALANERGIPPNNDLRRHSTSALTQELLREKNNNNK